MHFFSFSLKKTKHTLCCSAALLSSAVFSCSAHAQQWYTGSLLSPAPAKDRAGQGTIEPYFTYSLPVGYFDATGTSHPQHPRQQQFSNSTLWKYGITDALSIQAHTVVSYSWKKDSGHSGGPKFGDLPIDMIWRFVNGNPKRYIPTFNLFAGVVFPTGDYSNLSNSQDGVGNGTYVFRTALLSQSAYRLPGNHPLRLRTWAWWRRSLNSADISGISSYSTQAGFHRRARPGLRVPAGFSPYYGATHPWVFVLDVSPARLPALTSLCSLLLVLCVGCLHTFVMCLPVDLSFQLILVSAFWLLRRSAAPFIFFFQAEDGIRDKAT